MSIRKRLLVLILLAAIGPMVMVALGYSLAMWLVEKEITTTASKTLETQAIEHLKVWVNDYGRLLKYNALVTHMGLNDQANAVRGSLGNFAGRPNRSFRIFPAHAFDAHDKNIPNLKPSNNHFRLANDGKLEPIWISCDCQSLYTPPGVTLSPMQKEQAKRLGWVTPIYQGLYESLPHIIFWQYTALESGVMGSYPGKGGYPEGYDPRKRLWYQRAKQHGDTVWVLTSDALSSAVVLTVAKPIYGRSNDAEIMFPRPLIEPEFPPEGPPQIPNETPKDIFQGVTAIDIRISAVMDLMELQHNWAPRAKKLIVSLPDNASANQLNVLLRGEYEHERQDWKKIIEPEPLTSSDAQTFRKFITDLHKGRGGVLRMDYQGRDCLWAYSTPKSQVPISAVVIVPFDDILRDSLKGKAVVRQMTLRALAAAGGLFIAVLLTAIWVAVHRSRQITRPVQQLVEAGEALARDDFSAHVDITTHDELQKLGETFNRIGPHLAERRKIKDSLARAQTIQQHLLPERTPSVDGFDIVGIALPCDETGGDYFDFIELPECPNEIGVALGDITGHGYGAALLMASARAILRSHAVHNTGSLGQLFEDINTHLVRDTGDERFFTLFYGQLNAETNMLRWVSGGHDPAMWYRAKTKHIEPLAADGLVLGIVEDVHYEECGPIRLDAGDLIVVGTDGIWESLNPQGEEFGRERFKQIILDHAQESAEEIAQAVIDAAAEFRATAPQEDDITLIVVKTL